MPENVPHRAPTTAVQRRLRFCMVTTFYPPHNFGGDGIFVERLARALASQGHHVTVVYCVDAYKISGGDAEDQPVADYPEQDIDVHALRSFSGPLSPLITHQFAVPGLKRRTLRRIFAEQQFDVTHFHNVSLVGGPGILDYGSGVKLYTAHEYWLVCPLSTLWTFRETPCERKQCVSCTLRSGKPPQWWRFSSLLRRKLLQLDALIAPSQFSINKHHEFGLDLDFVHLPNFLPLEGEQASPAPAHTSITQTPAPRRPFFLMVGRLEQSKGFHTIVEHFATHDCADLMLVGSGKYQAELARRAQGCSNITLAGHLPYAQLRGLYRAATAVIVPSIWDEPFGLIVLEAFAQSTPVIVNDSGALPELVAASGGGLVYRNGDELRAALEKLLQDSACAQAMGKNGHDAYLQRWTDKQHLHDYLALIATRNPALAHAVPSATD